MNKPFYKGRLSINKEKSSPYWMVTFQGPDGKMRRALHESTCEWRRI